MKRAVSLCVVLALGLTCLFFASSCGSKPNSWIDLKPSGAAPSPRFGEALLYLSATGKVFMFGGAPTEKDPLNDTWMYDPQDNRWLDLKASGDTPPPRWAMGAAYDPTANRVLIFGGMGTDGSVLNDTWSYSVAENTWAKLSPSSSPSARYRPVMAYDKATGKFILFGGRYSRPGFQQDFDDTWAFDLAEDAWTNLSPSGDGPAPSAGSASLIEDGPDGRLLLLAGLQPLPPIPPYIPPNKLNKDWSRWVYDSGASNWTSSRPSASLSPAASEYYALAFNSTLRKAVLFGGLTVQNGPLNDTWIYDPVANTWVLGLVGGPDAPSPRIDCAIVYDPKTNRVILFGGRSVEGNEWNTAVLPSETWAYVP